jgi:delta(3,5)-delta(2,4)-dienoyl-CoA isomerase
VICVLHGLSIGFALDIATSCDVRICTSDVTLAVKEVDIGLAADIGVLNRLPKIIGSSTWIKDICYSARNFGADEALREGLVSLVAADKPAALELAFSMAKLWAAKSPVAVQGTKELLNHSRENSVANSK